MRVVTSMSRSQFDAFGDRMQRSVWRHWHPLTLDVWSEDALPGAKPLSETGYGRFRDRFRGRERGGWKYDLRFAAKVFALTESARAEDGVLVWLDADTVTRKDVGEDVVRSWLPDGVDLAYLGRAGSTSECGIVLYRMTPEVRRMLERFREVYETGEVFSMPEWHDSYVFDVLRSEFVPEERQMNLSPGGRGYEHVFAVSPVGEYIEHMKGPKRKRLARSMGGRDNR